MEYRSCIKIRGISILPPLMTQELRSEMCYYKQLALAVEEKLSRQRLSPRDSPETIKSTSTPRISRNPSKSSKAETISDDETTLTKSTDLNKYLVNPSDTSDTSSEPSKPRIPTSLDIIPITLDSQPLKKSKSSSSLQNSSDEPKKLVRQGSYTLDTPSPLLLAHLDQKRPEYTPTSSKNPQKRKEWNLHEAKSVWNRSNSSKKGERGGAQPPQRSNGSLECIYTKSTKLERSKSNYEVKRQNSDDKNHNSMEKNLNSTEKRRENQDLNLSGKRLMMRSRNKNFGDKNEGISDKNGGISDKNGGISDKNGNFDEKKKLFNEKIDKKIGGSLGDLIGCSGERNGGGEDRMSKSLDTNDFEIGTSERLLGVFREIQRTHERQMADLIENQRKEQEFMQQAFEKQQLMLLEQIDKTFPGISIMELVKRVRDSEKKRMEWKNEEFSSSFDSDGSISINLGEGGDVGSPEGRLQRSGVNRQLFPLEGQSKRIPVSNGCFYDQRHVRAATIINAYARGFLVRRMMKTERIISLKNTYREALHCMLKLTIDAPLELPELNFHKRLQLQCDAASMNIVELFSQIPSKRMEIIAHDRNFKKSKMERPSSARSSISFATQRTLARKKLKELGIYQLPDSGQSTSRTRCQTWTSNNRDKKSPGIVYRGIKRSTSAGAVRKPWR